MSFRPLSVALGLACAIATFVSVAYAQETSYVRNITVTNTVDNPAPVGLSQTVEFTVTVANVGEKVIFDATIIDKLPEQLMLPEVMVPVASIGSYNLESGEWQLGDMEPGSRETLMLPAIYSGDQQPSCVVNEATFNGTDDYFQDNSARSALHGLGVEYCVDLWISADKEVDTLDPCDRDLIIAYTFTVHNSGPDDAHNVVFTVREPGQFKMPGFHFESEECAELECRLALLPGNSSAIFYASSKTFKAEAPNEHSFVMNLTSSDIDYNEENNTGYWEYGFGGGEGICVDNGGAGSGMGCFIATAAYGTPFDARIDILRGFRDRWLNTNAAGRVLVQGYYRHSPPIAKYIADTPILRSVVRGLLTPVILVLTYPFISLALIVLLISLFIFLRVAKVRHQSSLNF